MPQVQGRIDSMNILLQDDSMALLAEAYDGIVPNINHIMLAGAFKHQGLSVTPSTGSIEVKRVTNSVVEEYRTARARGGGAADTGTGGTPIVVEPVTVKINNKKEIVEVIEEYDLALFGLPGLWAEKTRHHAESIAYHMEEAFWKEAYDNAGTDINPAATEINEIFEEVIQTLETTKNPFTRGMRRVEFGLVCDTNTYGKIRNFLDTGVNNANINTDMGEFGRFHGVDVVSSVFLPAEAGIIGMKYESIAMPARITPYNLYRKEQTDEYSLDMFAYYGLKTITPDHVVKVDKANI